MFTLELASPFELRSLRSVNSERAARMLANVEKYQGVFIYLYIYKFKKKKFVKKISYLYNSDYKMPNNVWPVGRTILSSQSIVVRHTAAILFFVSQIIFFS